MLWGNRTITGIDWVNKKIPAIKLQRMKHTHMYMRALSVRGACAPGIRSLRAHASVSWRTLSADSVRCVSFGEPWGRLSGFLCIASYKRIWTYSYLKVKRCQGNQDAPLSRLGQAG